VPGYFANCAKEKSGQAGLSAGSFSFGFMTSDCSVRCVNMLAMAKGGCKWLRGWNIHFASGVFVPDGWGIYCGGVKRLVLRDFFFFKEKVGSNLSHLVLGALLIPSLGLLIEAGAEM